eukprot:12515153-Heterocapsa_arctica.AAC.1
MGTCKGQAGLSTIDFFVAEGNLAEGIKEVSTVLQVEPHPHRPVRMRISTKDADYSYWAFETPPAIPNVRMVGPSPEPPKWSGMQQSTIGIKKCIA